MNLAARIAYRKAVIALQRTAAAASSPAACGKSKGDAGHPVASYLLDSHAGQGRGELIGEQARLDATGLQPSCMSHIGPE